MDFNIVVNGDSFSGLCPGGATIRKTIFACVYIEKDLYMKAF
jgi:hypothetical protein